MSMFIDSHGRLGHTHEQHLAVKCPHCQVMSHITPVSTPGYAQLLRYKPKHVGIVYRCDSCNSPVFLKYPVKAYGSDRVELSTSYAEIEKPKEKFGYMYLPEKTEALFKEALTCYSNNCPNAFASMCRRTSQAIFHDLGGAGKLLNGIGSRFANGQVLLNTLRAVVSGVVHKAMASIQVG